MGPASVAPDLALLFASHLLEVSPRLVVEIGSGVSTLFAGYSLQYNGRGRLISFEHDESFANATAASITQHALDDWVRVVHAPLTETTLCGQRHLWYDLTLLKSLAPGSIDVLLVDGPPGTVQKFARYPALPLLSEYLGATATILVDDADREDEKVMVDRWLKEYPRFVATYLPTTRGCQILTSKSGERLPPTGFGTGSEGMK
jgi:predicted O-methyltransferase YrrM